MEKKISAVRKNGKLVGVVLEDGQRLMISHWEHRVLKKFTNLEVRVPKKGANSRFINLPIILRDNGQIIQVPSYWRMGTMLGKILITRTYKFIGSGEKRNERQTKLRMPFGQISMADLEVCLATHKESGETRLILNFFLREKNEEKKPSLRVKMGGKKSLETVAEIKVPGTKEIIYIEKIAF